MKPYKTVLSYRPTTNNKPCYKDTMLNVRILPLALNDEFAETVKVYTNDCSVSTGYAEGSYLLSSYNDGLYNRQDIHLVMAGQYA